MRYLFGWTRVQEKVRRYRIVEISVWLDKSPKEGKEVSDS